MYICGKSLVPRHYLSTLQLPVSELLTRSMVTVLLDPFFDPKFYFPSGTDHGLWVLGMCRPQVQVVSGSRNPYGPDGRRDVIQHATTGPRVQQTVAAKRTKACSRFRDHLGNLFSPLNKKKSIK